MRMLMVPIAMLPMSREGAVIGGDWWSSRLVYILLQYFLNMFAQQRQEKGPGFHCLHM